MERILSEDALKHIYQCERLHCLASLQSVAGALCISTDVAAKLTGKMVERNLLALKDDHFRLTSQGRKYALQVIRAHRLWERYLADETGFAEFEWHEQADRREHDLSPAEMATLSARLGHPTHDPHGDLIPTAEGKLPAPRGQPLATLEVGELAQIIHLEDEPEAIYAQLVAQGLAPGLRLRLLRISPQAVYFQVDDRECQLDPLAAANVRVVPLPKEQEAETRPCRRLAELPLGQPGKVVSISPACRGAERRRFMDLGILPDTLIMAELRSPSGDPTAYRLRGTLIALRREQANLINVTCLEGSEE
jgi:DtxR family Mn-dependent transcriptional regulator